MLEGFNAQLPTRTHFLVHNYQWLYIVLFVGAGALVVGKEVFIRNKKLSIAITFLVCLGVLNAVGGIIQALYAPILNNK